MGTASRRSNFSRSPLAQRLRAAVLHNKRETGALKRDRLLFWYRKTGGEDEPPPVDCVRCRGFCAILANSRQGEQALYRAMRLFRLPTERNLKRRRRSSTWPALLFRRRQCRQRRLREAVEMGDLIIGNLYLSLAPFIWAR